MNTSTKKSQAERAARLHEAITAKASSTEQPQPTAPFGLPKEPKSSHLGFAIAAAPAVVVLILLVMAYWDKVPNMLALIELSGLKQ